ncbi:MAG TPA: hypothetical protein VNB90_00345 [Cytophagaceae bacterium]|nr:hypothetical protein [Cytophagaceae bacterium]
MKKVSLVLLTALTVATLACKKKKDDVTPSGDNSQYTELSGNLSTMTLDASKKYLLKGQVFVGDGQTLTIPAGTTIMGDKSTKAALIINLGGKIDAQGTASQPIIFTSAQAAGARDEGDWSGVILLGKAKTNWASTPTIEGITPAVSYGGTNDADNSGIMKYCRIEFAGIALSPNNETNGLTFGGVGNGTTIEYVQSSFGGDDSFEWFGGSVNCKHLVSYAAWDDDFDTDNGFSGQVQYGLAVRDPFQADQSGSNGFESDNDANASTLTPRTSAVFSNMTLLGPIGDTTKAISGNFQSGAHIRRSSLESIYNTIWVGFKEVIRLQDANTSATLKGNIAIIAGFNKNTASTFLNAASGTTYSAVATQWNADNTPNNISTASSTDATNVIKNLSNTLYYSAMTAAGINSNLFVMNNSAYPADPNFAVSSGALTSGFVTIPAGMETVSYRGAFGATDWTDGWANFDPKNASY